MRLVINGNEYEKNLLHIGNIELKYPVDKPGVISLSLVLKSEYQSDLARYVERVIRDQKKDLVIELFDDNNTVIKPTITNAKIMNAMFMVKERIFIVDFEGKAVL